MKPIPFIPDSAPFSAEQRAWINGYLAGLFSDARADGVSTLPAAPPAPSLPLLVLFGSQTGTAEQLAKKLTAAAQQRGYPARLLEMNAFAPQDFKKEQVTLLVTSTWGDGEPPDNATTFWTALNDPAAPKLEHLNYSVLALGDKNYGSFCGAGQKFDERLAELGAKRLQPRVDCDLDYQAPAQAWMENVWKALASLPVGQAQPAGPTAMTQLIESPSSVPAPAAATAAFDRKNPFPARLLTNRHLNGPGSAKDTRHFEISLEGSPLSYLPGDALGVMPANSPQEVAALLDLLSCDGEEAVTDPQGRESALRHALLRSYTITRPSEELLQLLAQRPKGQVLRDLLEPGRKKELEQFLHGREILDLLQLLAPGPLNASEFVATLRPLQPRLYSISSSPKAHPGQVHLTVAMVRYAAHGRQHKGVCSTFLGERVEPNGTVPVFVQTSHGFRLPSDNDRPVIMIGPGTGIAPFRAFLEERQATGAKGRNWLLFGDQQQSSDFLYRDQLEAWVADSTLTRLDTAFSRDQSEKIYVQTRLREQGKLLWLWLEEGAHLYVCGDAKLMAKDVDATLHEVVQEVGGRSREAAIDYMNQLKTEKRYQRDVY